HGVRRRLRVRHLLGGGGGRGGALFRDGGGRAGDAGQRHEGERAEGSTRLSDKGFRPGGRDPALGAGAGQRELRERRGDGVTVNGETLLGMFRTVSRINACDERLRGLLNQGKIFIFYYSPRGQEIIPAAVSACLGPDDYVVTTYRGLHDEIAKGAPLRPLMAEILGRSD